MDRETARDFKTSTNAIAVAHTVQERVVILLAFDDPQYDISLNAFRESGGARELRTPDLLPARQTLY